MPYAVMPRIATINPNVGSEKIFPDSRTPRRLASVRTPMMALPIHTRHGRSAGTADVIAATPAATDTATVST